MNIIDYFVKEGVVVDNIELPKDILKEAEKNRVGLSVRERVELNERFLKATKEGNIKKVVRALREGAHINAKTKLNNNALIQAINFNHIELAEMLIDLGIDINHSNHIGARALHYAAMIRNLKLIRKLIDRGAINAKDKFGNKAIDYARENKREDVVKYLETL